MLSDQDNATLADLSIGIAFFGLLGALFSIGCFIKYYAVLHRFWALKLVLFVAICDGFYAIQGLMGDPGHPDDRVAACQFQAIIRLYFGIASVVWASSIAFSLHMAVLKSNQAFASNRVQQNYAGYYHALGWGLGGFLTLLPTATGSLGDAGAWCWIKKDTPVAVAWRFICFYIPVWLAFGYNLYVYRGVHRLLEGIHAEHTKQGGKAKIRGKSLLDQAKYYPLILVICYFFSSLNRIVETISGEQYLWLSSLHTFTAGLRPLMNGIVMGLSPGVIHLIRKDLDKYCPRVVTFFGCKPLSTPEPDYQSEDGDAGAEEIELAAAAAHDNKEEYKERPVDPKTGKKASSSMDEDKRSNGNGKATAANKDNSQVSQPGAAQSQHDSIHSSAYEMVDVPLEEPPSPIPGDHSHQSQPHGAVECRIEIKEPATVTPAAVSQPALPAPRGSEDAKVVFHDDPLPHGPAV